MTSVYRIHYVETTGEIMPERSDLCVFANGKEDAKEIAQEIMGIDFEVLEVKRTNRPSNVINLRGGL